MPADLDRYIKDIHLATFASYDYVLLNSVYSYRWWHHFAEDMVNRTRAVHKIMPSIEVLHPPVHVSLMLATTTICTLPNAIGIQHVAAWCRI